MFNKKPKEITQKRNNIWEMFQMKFLFAHCLTIELTPEEDWNSVQEL